MAKKQNAVVGGSAILSPVVQGDALTDSTVRKAFLDGRISIRDSAVSAIGLASKCKADDLRSMIKGEWTPAEMYTYLHGDRSDTTYTESFLNNARVNLRTQSWLSSIAGDLKERGLLEYTGRKVGPKGKEQPEIRPLTLTDTKKARVAKAVSFVKGKLPAPEAPAVTVEGEKGADQRPELVQASATASPEGVAQIAKALMLALAGLRSDGFRAKACKAIIVDMMGTGMIDADTLIKMGTPAEKKAA